ncbi:FtsB family cell division protein [Alkalihalobacillus pseudalcaliphilus]|uniref:FtsB family cell division protein n=1 Tax=Alkalihalobacillus pseudalcaliphilus TaxID=79884 RepID=UPI0023613399|nr:septum formation initiator family protein [Alkalihalobacillus pseudalcaliphilus]
MKLVSKRHSAVRDMDTAYKQQREMELDVARKKRRGLVKRLSALGAISVVLALIGGVMLFNQLTLASEKQEQKVALEQKLESLLAEEQFLEQEIINYNDPDYIAEIARRDLFYTKEGEILFTLPKTSTD